MRNDVKEFWDEYAPEHMEIAYNFGKSTARYPFYETRLARLLELLAPMSKGRVLDAGCGGGQCMIPLADAGWDAHGCDASEKMIEFAKRDLAARGHDPARASVGGVEDLSQYKDNCFDVIFSMGVIEYLTDDQERAFYRECRRVLKDDGTLIVEYINSLFDLLTFNRFTVNFYRQNILPKFFGDDQARMDALTADIGRLLTYPNKPDLKGKYSTTRDQVYNRVENPITFHTRAKGLGFLQTDLLFYRFHAVPPLLFEARPQLEAVPIDFEKTYCRDWIGHFMASAFIAVLTKS